MHKRTSVPLSRARWLMPLAALLSVASLGCPGQELAPLGPCTVSAVSERVDQAGVSDVDLLFVIDNSGSMASEQAKIAKELPRLVQVLTSGDRCAGGNEDDCTYDDNSTPKRHFTAVKALHLGVVSVNAGGIDNPPGAQAGVLSCKGLGDDGKLQTSVQIATDGVTAMGAKEFDGYANGEVVIPADDSCAIGDQPKYQNYTAGGKATPAEVAHNFSCVARLGVRGCSFEQQLESMWKALAPSSGEGPKANYKFINGSNGQGDGYNKGFLRDDAILAVILVSDEEDCSITDDGKVLFLQSKDAEQYGPINLRCGLATDLPNVDDLIQPTTRYISGLKSLKPDNPDRILFAAIVGIPLDTKGKSPDEILDMPAMKFGENPLKLGFPRTSCTGMTGSRIDEAYPGRRYMEVASEFGENAVVYSICEQDYAPALDTLIGKIASKLKGNCLPRKLNPGSNGRVNCQVFELLNKADSDANKCIPGRGHTGSVIKRPIRENGKIVQKSACLMDQVTVLNGQIGTGKGWYYDEVSPELKDDCQPGEQQRIQFKFADGNMDLPSGAGATFECFQPVARVDNNAKGFDAINTTCLLRDQCGERSDDAYKLICVDKSKTCQIKCTANPDCPPGWVCDHAGGGGNKEGPLYCQLPTCPADSSSSSSTEPEK